MNVPPLLTGKAVEYKRVDFCGEDGARQIVAWIMTAWRKVGQHNVRAWVIPTPLTTQARKTGGLHQTTVYNVVTNLINGLPPSSQA